MELTKAKRNSLMRHLLRGGLKAEDCMLREHVDLATSTPTYQITHKPTDSKFEFSGPLPDGAGRPAARPVWMGRTKLGTDPWKSMRNAEWARLVSNVQQWAEDTAEWARTPDLWALDTATLPDAADNSPFTEAERDEVAKRLDEMHDYVRENFDLPDDQLAAIGQAVEDLKGASERIGRKDWKLAFYGAFLSLGLEHAGVIGYRGGDAPSCRPGARPHLRGGQPADDHRIALGHVAVTAVGPSCWLWRRSGLPPTGR